MEERKKRNPPLKYTKEMLDYLAEEYKIVEGKQLTKSFNEKFGTNVKYDALMSYLERHNIKSGRSYCYEKGHRPANKGKKLADLHPPEVLERIQKTMFKKGHRPANYKTVGTIRVNTDGYKEIKVSDVGTQHQRWHLLHREIWEQVNGPIPKGHVLIFKDNNPLNCSLDNLELVTRREHMMLNKCKLRGVDNDTTITGLNVVKLKLAIIDKGKEYKNGKEKQVARS